MLVMLCEHWMESKYLWELETAKDLMLPRQGYLWPEGQGRTFHGQVSTREKRWKPKLWQSRSTTRATWTFPRWFTTTSNGIALCLQWRPSWWWSSRLWRWTLSTPSWILKVGFELNYSNNVELFVGNVASIDVVDIFIWFLFVFRVGRSMMMSIDELSHTWLQSESH